MAETNNIELIPNNYGVKDCSDPVISGTPSNRYDFVLKPSVADSGTMDPDLNLDAPCTPWYYYNMKVGNLQVLENVQITGELTAVGDVKSNGGAHVLSSKKNLPFDMEHPNKKGWRLRHVCIEGPEIAVYCRGIIKGDGIIVLPSYWDGLVNYNDLIVNLTPIGHWQELYIKEFSGNKIIIANNNNTSIHANYHIIARRLDDDLVVEYEGESYNDYPNGNDGYSFNYEHTYVVGLIEKLLGEKL